MKSPETCLWIEQELARAEQARKEGLEGRARVCARRAAGMAVRAYFQEQNVEVGRDSAYDLLNRLRAFSGASQAARQSAARLVARVNVEFNLPEEVDLIVEARRLVENLAQEK